MQTLVAIGGVIATVGFAAAMIAGGCGTNGSSPGPPPPDYGKMSEAELDTRAGHEDHDAEYELGRCAYRRQDAGMVKWFCRAAEAGHPAGRYMVGLLYEPDQQLRVLDPSYARAYMWLSFAAAGNNLALKEKNRLVNLMTAEQIAEARQLIAAWTTGSCGNVS